MNRAGLIIAIAIGAATAVVFAARPELDLWIAGLFYRPGRGFLLFEDATVKFVRDAGTLLVGILAVQSVWSILVKLVRPERRMAVPARTAVFLAGSLILGPLFTANYLFKENWNRPRPNQLVAFGGHLEPFRPWWDPRGNCEGNCSFVGGETAAAFWTLAPAALAPPQWRPLAYGAAVAFGAAVSVVRVAAGGHFFSDVVFAALIAFLFVWVMHGWLYRWGRHPTDAAVEHAIEKFGWALRRPFGRAPANLSHERGKTAPDERG
jgi:lipid A 4'-phosphatase